MAEVNTDQFANAINEQLKNGQAIDDNFNQHFKENQNRISAAQNELLNSFVNIQAKPELDPRVQDIVNALQGQPMLIEPVEKFLASLVKSMNEAYQSAINKHTEGLE